MKISITSRVVPGKGFFYDRKVVVGGEETNLYKLDKEVLRNQKDPRLHFALNCGSESCPVVRPWEWAPTMPRSGFARPMPSQLPFNDSELDGLIAECTFSLFSEQETALAEIRRVLKPRGKLAITDMATRGALPEDIAGVLAPWTCLADAVDEETYLEMFAAAGFKIQTMADESAA